jgi:hypothetical protein
MERRCRMRMAARLRLAGRGYLGKKFQHGVVHREISSVTARPTAVEVKLLLKENNMWGLAAYGAHQPSATTASWRSSIKLCKS